MSRPKSIARCEENRARAVRLLLLATAAAVLASCSATPLLFEVQQRVGAADIESRTYTVTFDAQGGSDPDPATITVILGEPYGELPDSVLTDYSLFGWRSEPGGAGSAVSEDTVVAVEGDHTLYADWVTPGSTWTQAPSLPDTNFAWRTLAYGDGTFVAMSEVQVSATSPDGRTWTERTLGDEPGVWSGAVYGGDRFVAVWDGADKIGVSMDGILWDIHYESSGDRIPLGYWTSVAYGSDTFFAVSRNHNSIPARAASSIDGYTWQSYTPVANEDWMAVAYGSNRFVTISSESGTVAYMSSSLLGTWSEATFGPSNQDWSDLTFGEGLFVAIARNTDVYETSPNGNSWTEGALPNSRDWVSIAYGNGQFVAIARHSRIVATSPDGITWTEWELPVDRSWMDVAYGDNRFVAIANDGTVVTSP
jgi:hypothetical protein